MLTNVLGRAECGHFETAAGKEWLVTNGLGGFAAGTVGMINTRRYHGLLVAALRPPLGRTLLVAKVDATAQYGDQHYPLFTNEFGGGYIDPHGYRQLESFRLEGTIPLWSFALADARLEQRIWMAHGHNSTYLSYRLTHATAPLTLSLTPLCTYRDYHSHSRGGWFLPVEPVAGGFQVDAFEGAQPYRVLADRGDFQLEPDWYWNFRHRRESERGLDAHEDLLAAGRFSVRLEPGQSVTLICTSDADVPADGDTAYQQEQQRQAALLEGGQLQTEPAWISHLALAADQFIVQRAAAEPPPDGSDPAGATVIAGYHWFGDWGRDTMIALPGLTLATHRPEIAAGILRTFARYIDRGMLPNRFPDGGETPEYNTVDATLWYFQAIYRHLLYTEQPALVEELYPALADIIDWHRRGTRYSIKVDSADGLLFAGEPGVQLTWMDAKVGDWVVTPRIGKPVEVNALWYNALRIMAELAGRLDKPDEARVYADQAQSVADSFRRRFWFDEGGYLYDVIDGPDGKPDAGLRPNQLFAVALPFSLLNDDRAKAVVDTCARRLWTSYGLRSLAPTDPAYIGQYGGRRVERDGAYHQGTVWGWLLGPFVEAHYRVYGDATLARSFLGVVEPHLADGCFGSVSEIFDGDTPHSPRGTVAQAWSVAEILRVWRQLGS